MNTPRQDKLWNRSNSEDMGSNDSLAVEVETFAASNVANQALIGREIFVDDRVSNSNDSEFSDQGVTR